MHQVIIYGNPAFNKPGYWDPVTALIDWCEENYIQNRFIAEYWNTISNVGYFLLFLATLKKLKTDDFHHFNYSIAIMILAIGSGLYHATLSYEAQLLDECPMILIGVTMMFDALSLFKVRFFYPGNFVTKISPLLITLAICIANEKLRSKVFFQTLFGIIIFSSFFIIGLANRKSNRSNRNISRALFIAVFGFVLWIVDSQFCEQIIQIRRNSKLLGVLLQGHMWWHLLTALSGYYLLLERKQRINAKID
ncbi:Alkaline ceramidase 3 [Thelohanellus kitauei]|uniref:Alkaline ceramidase n=1 Tax=Thelohanellus kitauei TaxID=669202 RepID=A0A0C2M842_THEKT|nr:Alkaline ceramidase 3 [Thelohanellus kitauei]